MREIAEIKINNIVFNIFFSFVALFNIFTIYNRHENIIRFPVNVSINSVIKTALIEYDESITRLKYPFRRLEVLKKGRKPK